MSCLDDHYSMPHECHTCKFWVAYLGKMVCIQGERRPKVLKNKWCETQMQGPEYERAAEYRDRRACPGLGSCKNWKVRDDFGTLPEEDVH